MRRTVSKGAKKYLGKMRKEIRRQVLVLNGEENSMLSQICYRNRCKVENSSKKVFDGDWFLGYRTWIVGYNDDSVNAAYKQFQERKRWA
ncbi:MAG: hypothetical protein KBA11_05910 [Sedimentibacter sp.]|nr:hypothetical protein [Sedimentibacter sp.]